ncbi:hypothetical protein CGL27_28635 [Streptomyces sp. 11-1-2]|nr:hypothetical protein CGL27_28635 [Streptomyces sp. 11-1-2]
MNLTALRFLLSPITSWRAIRMVRSSGWTLSFDAAWRATRTATCPDERVYQSRGHTSDPSAPPRMH